MLQLNNDIISGEVSKSVIFADFHWIIIGEGGRGIKISGLIQTFLFFPNILIKVSSLATIMS